MKRFIYLVQSEKGLDRRLKKLEGSDSDVLLLTWKKPVKNAIFFPFSTWTEGRNRLYQEVFRADYLYYIFIDGDIELKTTKLHKNHNTNPWRIYEKNLLKYLPAIGVPCLYWSKQSSAKVETIYWYDGISIAVHREALKTVFPLYDGDDSESWWNPGIYFFHTASLLYPNHTLQFNEIEAVNKLHYLYPRRFEWVRIDAKFKNCILDIKLKKSFQPLKYLTPSSNGRVEVKNRSYEYKQEELSHLFNFSSRIFKRRISINKNITGGEPYAVCMRSRLPYWGEYVCKKFGVKSAVIIFEPLVILYEFKKKAVFLVGEIKSAVSKDIGIFLKNTRPWRHKIGLKRN